MQIFNDEKHLEHLLSKSVTTASANASFLSREKRLVKAAIQSGKVYEDLYPVYSLLVSSVWNENDDVFTAQDLINAKNTPIHHPTNIDHEELNIVGHITDCWAVDGDMQLIVGEEVPEKVHLIIESVIYTHFRKKEKKAEIEKLIQQVENFEKFVSMEVFFNHFDYAIEKDGQYGIIKRDENSAFLTKYLKYYGGSGEYQGYRIGRVIRDFYFIGKGYVDDPANKESKILSKDSLSFMYAFCIDKNKKIIHDFANKNNNGVQLDIENTEKIMPIELETQLAEARAENEKLIAQLEELNKQNFPQTISSLEKSVADLNSEKEAKISNITELENKVSELMKANELSVARITELEKNLSDVNEAKAQIEKEQKIIIRTSELVGAGLNKAEAGQAVSTYFDLNDEQWAGVCKLLIKSQANSVDTDVTTTVEPSVTTLAPEDTRSLAFNLNSNPDKGFNQRLEQLRSGVATLLKGKK